MSTATFESDYYSVYSGTLVRLTYTVSSTADKTTFSLTKVELRDPDETGMPAHPIKVYVAGSVLLSQNMQGGASPSTWKAYTVSKSVSFTRGSTATTKQVRVYEDASGSGYGKGYLVIYGSTEPGFNFTVPAAVYTNTYKANGGTGSDQTQSHNYGSSFTTLASNTFSRTNYEFSNWNTASDGGGTSYNANTSYTVNSNLTLYAIWTQVYASPQISITKAYRCDSNGNADDEGTYAAIEYSFQIWNTPTENTATVTAEVDDGSVLHPSATSSTFTAGGTGGGWSNSTGKLVVNANMQAENSYNVSATVTDTQGGTSGRSSASATKSTQISTAFYLMDFLGDRYLYNLTEDSAIDQGKTYYELVDGEYVAVEDPDVSDIGSYYEANGPRPGHGVTFCGVADREGFNSRAPISVLEPFVGYNADSSCFIVQDPSNFPTSQDAAPSENIFGDLLAMRQDDFSRVHVRAVATTDGRQGVQIETARISSSNTTTYNGLRLYIAADGTRSVDLSDAAAWRSALGFSITTQDKSVTSSVMTLNAGSGTTVTLNLAAPSGYGFMGILRVVSNHSYACSLGAFNFNGSSSTVEITNRGSTKFTDLTVTMAVRYYKTTLT